MVLGIVEGTVVTTIKHPSMNGWRLLIVQPVGAAGGAEGDPVMAIDHLGAGHGSKVLLTNDGRGTRELVGDKSSPLRWAVAGIVDSVTT